MSRKRKALSPFNQDGSISERYIQSKIRSRGNQDTFRIPRQPEKLHNAGKVENPEIVVLRRRIAELEATVKRQEMLIERYEAEL